MSEPAAGRPLRLAASLEGSDGKPVLVLGNSLGTSRAIWEPQLPVLAAHFRLLRYELPGHGGAEPAARARAGPEAEAEAEAGAAAQHPRARADPEAEAEAEAGAAAQHPRARAGPEAEGAEQHPRAGPDAEAGAAAQHPRAGGGPEAQAGAAAHHPRAGGGPEVEAGAAPHHPPPGPYSIGDLGAAVLALLDERGIERASYCGISLGGMIGMWLAANAPARIAALGLCCTSAHMPPASGWTDRAALVRAEGMTRVTAPSLDRWFTPAFARSSPAVLGRVAAMLDGTVPEGYAGCCEAIAAMDLRPSLASITAPTLVMAATEDPSTPPPHGALIALAIPGARLRVVRGAAHLANVQTPGPVTAALTEHLLVSRPRSA
jgi:3-oxoadipate enol-lactonase